MAFPCGCPGEGYPWLHLDANPDCKKRAYVEWNWHIWLGQAFAWWATLNANGGRTMVCSYGGNERPSDPKAAFFEARPLAKHDVYYCGCYGWD